MILPEKRKRRRKSSRHEKSILREFSMEVFIGILFIFGVFLLFEKMEIKSSVFHAVVNTFQTITQGFSRLIGNILGTAELFETSDIVGTTLILLALFLLTVRVRQKAILRFQELTECPDCGSDLLHIHRNMIQRLAGKMFRLKIRRFHCKNCEFEGLRMREVKSR